MSSAIGHGLLHTALHPPAAVEKKEKTRVRSAISLSGRVRSATEAENLALISKKQLLSNRFLGNRISGSTLKGSSRARRSRPLMAPHAVLALDLASELSWKFELDRHSILEVSADGPVTGSPYCINIQISYNGGPLILHWGGIKRKHKGWSLPSHRPDGTQVYQNDALRTFFVQSGSSYSLKLEIYDPDLEAIEFLIVDESRNKWFKNNGQNFRVVLPDKANGKSLSPAKKSSNVSLPEDLVQIQSYLRWERRGKQKYTQSQEKEEYEAARAELLEEIARGISIEELRAKLTNPSSAKVQNGERNMDAKGIQNGERSIPADLIQVQAYVRWEKAGKPNYSKEKEMLEFEEARKDLQLEFDKGLSLEEVRKKLMKGDVQTRVPQQLLHKTYSTRERMERKKRDIMQLISKQVLNISEQKPQAPEVATALELFAKDKIKEDGGHVISKKIYKLGKKAYLALVTDANDKKKVYIAADNEGQLVLHWALSRNSREWMAPPSDIVPTNSVILEKACETPFSKRISRDPFYEVEVVEIEVDGNNFQGIPFVIRDGENWIKNNSSDFYIDCIPKSPNKDGGDGTGTAKALLDRIAELENEAQKSFMHRFNIAADLLSMAEDAGALGFAGILVWMRFMATRQLIWNKNYNVKPREISKAQDRLTDLLQSTFERYPNYREIVRLIMSAVGRGGEGDVGQRIRDEILVIQRNNDCKGGMMEEWHQKLHNNTSPDDVVICQALLDYVRSDFDISVYWRTLNSNGISKERLLSYDRAIHSEPSFRREQKEGLLRDLGNYMRTLKAVHSGADLESAITTCMGYKSEGEGFMVGVNINPIRGLPAGFPELLRFIVEHVEDKQVEHLLEGLLEAREELRPVLLKPHERLKDLIFLDLALDSTVRTVIERGYEALHNASPEKIMYFISLVLENLALSTDDNEDLIYCSKGWSHTSELLKRKDDQWALFAKSVLDRTRLALSKKSELYGQLLQPSAEYLGSKLGVESWAVDIFTEEIIRAGSAASLSALLNRLDPTLRKVANLGSWQIISPVEVSGYIAVVDELLSVQNKSYERPTILVAKSVTGEEEIPDGTVAVLTSDMPDVLSHVSVRARNGKVCFATCFDPSILSYLQGNEGNVFHLKPTSSDISCREIKESELSNGNGSLKEANSTPPLTLAKKKFMERYAVSAQEFNNDLVGAKSRNIAYLKGKVPSWVGVPTSVALPFGVFEKVLSDDSNKVVADTIQSLKVRLDAGEYGVLGDIRKTVLQLTAPAPLVLELKDKMKGSGMPWPGDEGEKRWEQAWTAIKKVWASKWNERAYFSTKKVKIDHDNLCMAVLVQEIISADYAFVIHTINPSSGDTSEIYAEVVKGLGETLVGAYPGRALSFVCKKNNLDSPMILGYPSKPVGLFVRPSLIFRSDSNGEDLEGYAGAGLYDSVAMDKEEEVVLDYSSDPLIVDANFRKSILSSIARAGHAIEELYGSSQDIEGVIKNGKLTVVQTRPQM